MSAKKKSNNDANIDQKHRNIIFSFELWNPSGVSNASTTIPPPGDVPVGKYAPVSIASINHMLDQQNSILF